MTDYPGTRSEEPEPVFTNRELAKLFMVLRAMAPLAEQSWRWDDEARQALSKVVSLVVLGPELDGKQLVWVNPFQLVSDPEGDQR